ncbi:MAG: mechanosensitive ion channel family protein [Gammaproteobacteria bacterium]|nr:mechanosensitive ion channel family protein [Gammaproteobacteria bacterium]
MKNMCDFVSSFHEAQMLAILKTIILIVSGFLLARITSKASEKLLGRYASSQQAMVFQKIIYFSILILFVVAGLQQLGFKLSVLLGSAGIATAAVAIASQTSISNIISGLFLIMEKSFQIGDRIKVGNTSGIISSIDLLSVKILTANNTLVRIPNELLIKSEITNITRFESRRLDLNLKVSSEENLPQIKALLVEMAKKNPLSLKTPLPSASIVELDGSDVYLQLSTWSAHKNYDALRDSLYADIVTLFHENNIAS